MTLSFLLVSSCWPITHPIVVSIIVKYKINDLFGIGGISKGDSISTARFSRKLLHTLYSKFQDSSSLTIKDWVTSRG